MHKHQLEYEFKLKNHYEIMLKADMIDTKRGTAVSGNQGYFPKNYGVLLNQVLRKYVGADFIPFVL